MKAMFLRMAERLDAATLRERIMVFVATAAVLAFAAHAMALQPLRAKQQRLLGRIQADQAEMTKLQASLQATLRASAVDPDASLRAREKSLRATLGELNAKVALVQRRFTPPDSMRGVLEELLERNPRLSLLDLRTVPAVPIAVRGGPGSSGLYRHGIELAVSGSYADLYEYLRALEAVPTQIYWGRAELEVIQHPAITLKVTLYTVSFDRAWLIV